MKKYSFIFIISLVFLITGCGNKKLICKHTKTDSFYGDNIVAYKLEFGKDNNLKSFVLDSEAKYNKEYINIYEVDMNSEFESAKEICKMYEESKNVECNVRLYNNNKIVINIKFDVANMTDEEFTSFGLAEYKNMSYDKAKENYEKSGFTCK